MTFRTDTQRRAFFARNRVSYKARKFISQKIRYNIKKGRPIRQSRAIAYSMARKRGYNV